MAGKRRRRSALRFVLDFAYATALRISELVNATLGQIEVDAHDALAD
ncbi:MAG TPA: hypothetical protein VIY29_15900 [Ktedonobacteraceae bacterium]